jgi:hypothetical protein
MKTFTQAIAELDPKEITRRKRAVSRKPTQSRRYPTLNESDRPNPTYINEDGEFSGREMTDWYVKRYCQLNTLKSV